MEQHELDVCTSDTGSSSSSGCSSPNWGTASELPQQTAVVQQQQQPGNVAGLSLLLLLNPQLLVQQQQQVQRLRQEESSDEKMQQQQQMQQQQLQQTPQESVQAKPVQATSKRKAGKQRRLYKCRHCAFQTDKKVDNWQHIRIHMRPEKLLACELCQFVTEYKHHLEYHQRNHSGYKPFKCDHCDYQCVNKSMLNSHMKSHSSVYQYQCGDCKYATKYVHSLKMHLRKYNHQPTQLMIDVYGRKRGPKSTSSTSSAEQQCNILDLRVDSKLAIEPVKAASTTTAAVALPLKSLAATTPTTGSSLGG